MKALVLAGGSGTRLRPITYTSAKQLVPLANKPILFFGLESIAAAGIREVGIIVGDTQPDIEAAVGDGSRFGLDVTYLRQDAPRGLAHAVLVAREFLADEPFVMYLGDNLVVGGIDRFVGAFDESTPDALVLVTKVANPEQFGVAELDPDGRVLRLVEKPAEPASDLALVGVYIFGAAVHEAVRSIRPSARGELEITEAIQWLVDSGRSVSTEVLTTPWIDTGKLQDLLEANRIVLERMEPGPGGGIEGSVDAESHVSGPVVLESGASLVRSTVRGPAVIGPGTLVEDSFVGPYTSIGAGCTVRDSSVEHAVLMEGAVIEGVERLCDSLVGRGASVRRAGERPRALRVHIGDHSEVRI